MGSGGGESIGRQVAFYMMAADEEELLRYLQERGDVAFLPDDNASAPFPELSGLPEPKSSKAWYFVNMVPRSELGGVRYRDVREGLSVIDKSNSPVVEWIRSIQSGSKLKEGRFWTDWRTTAKDSNAEVLYDDLMKWLKRNFTKMKRGRFFLGPDAKRWALEGGELIFGQDPWDYPRTRFETTDF